MKCDCCGGGELIDHCEKSETCSWKRCSNLRCRAYGIPGKRMRLPLEAGAK